MSNPTKRRLVGVLRSAYWNDVTAADLRDAGIADEDHARVLRECAKVRELYAGGDFRGAVEALDAGVDTLGDVRFGEADPADTLNPRRLAARAAGDPVPTDDRDEMDPRRLAEGIQLF